MASSSLERLQAAAIDGRAHNVYYRQTQLERLCKALLAEETALREAMISDSGYTPAEAIAVLHASIETVKHRYATLQPKEALGREYRIAHGKDAANAQVPVGVVYLEPEAHTLLYSICSPLSAAIAAGNCVFLLMENNPRTLPGLIRRILTTALDADTFAVTTSRLENRDSVDALLSVCQANGDLARSDELLSLNVSAVAVADRTADIQSAAKHLVRSRKAFGGRSPYSPAVVLVNEFAAKDFVQAAVAECSPKATSSASTSQSLSEKQGTKQLLEIDLEDGSISRQDLASVSLLDRQANGPVLGIRTFSSLDDALTTLSSSSEGCPYLAAYHFADLNSAKYLAQFIEAEVSFVNHIPAKLLMGPPSPSTQPFDLEYRYKPSMFERRRPAFIQTPKGDQRLAIALESPDNKTAQQLLAEAKKPLAVMKRSEGGGVGFFEQGFLMNASFILVSLVGLSATGAWQAWRWRSGR